MDRAHRLGQKRSVNVFRVLTRGTLEEKIMGLQRFKMDVANAVINKVRSGADHWSLIGNDLCQCGDKQGGRLGADCWTLVTSGLYIACYNCSLLEYLWR